MMRTTIKPSTTAPGKFELRTATGALLGLCDSPESARRLAVDLREQVKIEAAKMTVASLANGGGGAEFVTLSMPATAEPFTLSDVRVFADDMAAMLGEPLTDEHGNEIDRYHREGFVLRPGTFVAQNGVQCTFTPADLDEYAANHDPAYPPKIQLMHRDEPMETLGYVTAARTTGEGEGKRLHVLFEFRGEACKQARAGLLRDISGGFYRRPRQFIKEVSFVGRGAVGATGGEPARMLPLGAGSGSTLPPTPTPAPGAKPVSKLENHQSPKGDKAMNFWQRMFGAWLGRARDEKKAAGEAISLGAGLTEEDLNSLVSAETEIDEEKARTAAVSLGLDPAEVGKLFAAMKVDGAFKTTVKPATTATSTAAAALLGADVPESVKLAFEQQQAEIAELRAERVAEKKASRAEEDARDVRVLLKAGKILSKDVDRTVKFLASCSDEMKADFMEMHGSMPAELSLGRLAMSDLAVPPGVRKPEQVTAEARELMSLAGWKQNEKGEMVLG